jgi:hypothetical protein
LALRWEERPVEGAEKTVRRELLRLEIRPSESLLATALVDLAKRLDLEPGDDAAVSLSREMRLLSVELRRQVEGEPNNELERFLSGISTPSFRGPGD